MHRPGRGGSSKDEATLPELARALARLPGFSGIGVDDLAPIDSDGIAHAHFRVRGRGVVLRVPRLSQLGLGAADNLAYQAACFRRAQPSGRTPGLVATLPIGPELPFGALIVEEVAGRHVRLPGDLPAIAGTLSRIHLLKPPGPGSRAPLRDHAEPVAATLATILGQAEHLHDTRLSPEALDAIAEEIGWARQLAGEIAAGLAGPPQPTALVATDSHPGNFLIGAGGRAILVDLEKMLYGAPAIDLAHATLYTSTTWERRVAAALTHAETAGFYRAYLAAVPDDFAAGLRPWLMPMRRLTWLRTLTWMIRWRAVSARPAGDAALGPWSRERLPSDLVEHMLARIDDFTAPGTIARIRAEWADDGSLESLI